MSVKKYTTKFFLLIYKKGHLIFLGEYFTIRHKLGDINKYCCVSKNIF